MAKPNSTKSAVPPAIAPPAMTDPEPDTTIAIAAEPDQPDTPPADSAAIAPPDIPPATELEDSLNALKTLLSTVEKLQKARQDVGDIKPLLIRMLDGELLSGDELEQLKSGVGGLFKLVRAYGDHQTALNQAQPARTLLDQVLK